ncbi:hypothetical protein HYT57_04630 [Candidatus Woesearchaeota archaeon]|nr:hypothetical protein [Candidatus Woesearchaeota archaeon]
MYQKNFKGSWKLLFNNLELFVPDTVFYIVNLIFFVFVLNQLGLVNLLTSSNDLLQSKEALTQFLNSLDPIFFIKSVFYFLIFFMLAFLTGTGTDTAKFYMIRQLFLKKKLSFSDAFSQSARTFYFKLLGLKIVKFIVLIIPIVLIYILLWYIVPAPESFLEALFSKAILLIIALLLSLPFMIFFTLSFYFSEAALFLQKLSIKESLRNSYNFMKNNFLPLIFTILILFGVNLLISLFFNILTKILSPSIVLSTLSFIVVAVVALWGEIFLFSVYSELEKVKR